MRVLALHADVIVFVSRVWQTTCTAVRAGEEGFLIDSPVFPDELEALAGVLEQAGFPVSGLLATHGDWDHLLGRLAFPEAALGCAESDRRSGWPARAGERPAGAAALRRGALRRADAARWRWPGIQSLPVPGKLSVGAERELELHPAAGHTADGMAIRDPVGAGARDAATTSRRSRSR